MSKIILPLVILLIQPVFASYQMTTEALSMFSSFTGADSKREQFGPSLIARFYFNDKTKQLSSLKPGIRVENKGGFIQVNGDIPKYDGQCVSFIKAVSNIDISTSDWKPGERLKPNTNIPIGTVIATFKNGVSYNGKYDHAGIYYGHINGNMYILDQNWNPSSEGNLGYMHLHAFSYNSGGFSKSNANYYYVVEKKR